MVLISLLLFKFLRVFNVNLLEYFLVLNFGVLSFFYGEILNFGKFVMYIVLFLILVFVVMNG